MNSQSFPWSIVDLDSRSVDIIKKEFKGLRELNGFARIGPKGYLFPRTSDMEENLLSIYNTPARSSDIFITTFPRSGTTLTQELVWLLVNNLDYTTAKFKHLVERYVTVGCFYTYLNSLEIKEYIQQNSTHLNKVMRLQTPPAELLAAASDPRFIKCHLPLSLMPKNVLECAKVIYVARDPRDVAVSLYYQSKLFTSHDFVGDFKSFWDIFIKGLVFQAPYFEHVKEAWAVKDHPNMLFLFYEEFVQDMSAAIRKICAFLGKQYTDEQIAKLADHLRFEKFKKNQSVFPHYLDELKLLNNKAETFIRKGKVGEWRDYFDAQISEQAEDWIKENLRGTNLKFPHVSKQRE